MNDESDNELVVRALHTEPGQRWTSPDSSVEWAQWRREGIGASDIAGVLGLSPWASPWSVWVRKVGLTKEPDQTEAMEFGLMAEQMLARYFETRTGLWALGEQTRCMVVGREWMRCTVDGFGFEPGDPEALSDPDAAVCAIEYKTTSDAPEVWEQSVPLHYQCQATWTALVTGQAVVMFGVLHLAFGRPAFRVYTFTPSADDLALVELRASKFWHEHVQTKEPPPPDAHEATTEAMVATWAGDASLDAVEADPSLATAVDRIAANQERIRACEAVIDEQRNLIRAALGDATVLTFGVDAKGRPRVLATWKTQRRSGYTVADSESRVLRVNTPKGK